MDILFLGSLAREWEASMSDDMVYPVFHHGLFWNGGKSGTVFRCEIVLVWLLISAGNV